tara:strand:+ start:1286 stop:1936 length:651 start_codon:yes stop_codon:yes gene_type:complete
LAKRLTEKEKEKMVVGFTNGRNINELSKEFKRTKLTISRNIKCTLGEKKYKELIEKSKSSNPDDSEAQKIITELDKTDLTLKSIEDNFESENFPVPQFVEITPLNYEIDNSPQKDLSSIDINEIDFPKIVYMIVDKKIELETKYLKDYPEWQFLSQDELNRKTIEIYVDLKNAKRNCNKEQKVIKVPNTAVFKIVAPLLLARGISRIVSSDKLIAL